MQKTKIGYKVVRKDGERLTSYLVHQDAAVEYKVGEYVKPRTHCGPLCVFDTYKDALSYINRPSAIFKCRYVPSRFTSIWDGPRKDKRTMVCHASGNPKGSVLASMVKLIEQGR